MTTTEPHPLLSLSSALGLSLGSPSPGCGNSCLPPAGSFPTVPLALRVARLLAVVGVLLTGVVVLVRPAWSRGWFRLVLRAAGVRLQASTLDDVGTLVAANHISWLDVPTVLALTPARVVAKSDLRDWPVIGALAAGAGTIFIDRRRLRRLPGTVADIAASLRAGHNVVVFPEGTTWCGRSRGRYYPALFQAAIDARAAVRPVSISYRLPDGTVTTAAAFIGDSTMLSSVWRVVSVRGLTAHLQIAPRLGSAGATRRELALASRAARHG